jgi:hypothetical protein
MVSAVALFVQAREIRGGFESRHEEFAIAMGCYATWWLAGDGES